MNNNQRKKQRAQEHNQKRYTSLVRKWNNDYARDNFSIGKSYFIRYVLGNSNPKSLRSDMRDSVQDMPLPSGLSQETIDEGIQFLNQKSNELGENLVWEQVVKELTESYELDTLQATYVFISWVKYIDNRKNLAKAINFE
jgi:hypothetical protein